MSIPKFIWDFGAQRGAWVRNTLEISRLCSSDGWVCVCKKRGMRKITTSDNYSPLRLITYFYTFFFNVSESHPQSSGSSLRRRSINWWRWLKRREMAFGVGDYLWQMPPDLSLICKYSEERSLHFLLTSSTSEPKEALPYSWALPWESVSAPLVVPMPIIHSHSGLPPLGVSSAPHNACPCAVKLFVISF